MRKIKRKSYKDIFKRSYAIKLLKNKYLIKGFLKENEKLKINIYGGLFCQTVSLKT